MNTSVIKKLKNTFGYGTSTSVSSNQHTHTHTPAITVSSPINTALSGMICISGVCSSSTANYSGLNTSVTIGHNSLSGLQGVSGGYYHWGSSAASSIYYTPEQARKERIQQLKTELNNDPELLNEILTDLRKDKIERIKSKGGF